MIVEAIKKDDGYFIPIKGKKDKIKIFIDEDIEELDLLDLITRVLNSKTSKSLEELSKDEIRDFIGEELYRKYLLLDKKSMEENWEYLVRTKRDWGDGFEKMEEAINSWREK
jgi:hypothetical protein